MPDSIDRAQQTKEWLESLINSITCEILEDGYKDHNLVKDGKMRVHIKELLDAGLSEDKVREVISSALNRTTPPWAFTWAQLEPTFEGILEDEMNKRQKKENTNR